MISMSLKIALIGKKTPNYPCKGYLFILVLPLFLCISCLYARTTAQVFTVNKMIKINYGKAILNIHGRVSENLYSDHASNRLAEDVYLYDNPLIGEGTITKNEILYLSTGEEYKFSVLPAEVVTINIRSLDENDVKITVFESGTEKEYTIEGTNRMGIFLAFQNR
jgi:hypothetical protein